MDRYQQVQQAVAQLTQEHLSEAWVDTDKTVAEVQVNIK